MKVHYDGQRWRIQIMENGQRYSFSSSKSKKDVEAKYQAWLDSKVYQTKNVQQVADEYLDTIKAKNGETSEFYYHNEQYLRLYVLPKVGSKQINTMSLHDWQKLLNEGKTQQGKPLSKKTLKNLKDAINRLIKYGYENYYCDLPRGSLFIPKDREAKEKEIIQPNQLEDLLKPSGLWYHPLFCFLAMTGLRPGEGLGLQVDDVYDDYVIIRRAVNKHRDITDGKNKNAQRIIPLCSQAKDVLVATIKRNEPLNTKWIFCSVTGERGAQTSMRKDWYRLKAERNLSGTVYGLRHTFISLTKNLLTEQELKSVVGHSASMTTYETYAHHIVGEEKIIASKLEKLFGENMGK